MSTLSRIAWPQLPRTRQREIDDLNAQIQQGINAETCQEGLDLIEKTTPSCLQLTLKSHKTYTLMSVGESSA